MTRARVALAALVAACFGGALACSELFDEATQCKVDRDCAKYAAVCDVTHGVCVARSLDGADAGALDAEAPPAPPPPPDPDAGIDPRCLSPNKPTEILGAALDGGAAPDAGVTAEITASRTLDCTKDWIVQGRVRVRAGATLTIQPMTTIEVRKQPAPLGGIVIDPGAKIVANGTRDAPIVFTSAEATPARGDWEGLVVLGAAPSPNGAGGVQGDAELAYGGANAADSSGSLAFVRIEYAAYGLALGGVGSATSIDSIEARMLSDNCFTLLGGAAQAKHLVCQSPGDEMIEAGDAFAGKLQFVFGHRPLAGTGERHGILTDAASPAIYNATLCGGSQTDANFGLVIRNGSHVDLGDSILTGWFGGLDARDAVSPPVEVRGSIAFGNAGNPAYAEDPAVVDADSPLFDDDGGFDEIAFFRDAARTNAETDPGLAACADPKAPKPYPAASLTAGARPAPADGFFDPDAAFAGAFRDASDTWMTGAWVRFDDR